MLTELYNMRLEEAVKMTKILVYNRVSVVIELLLTTFGCIYLYQRDSVYSSPGKIVIFLLLLTSMYFFIIGTNNYAMEKFIEKKAEQMAAELKVIRRKYNKHSAS